MSVARQDPTVTRRVRYTIFLEQFKSLFFIVFLFDQRYKYWWPLYV